MRVGDRVVAPDGVGVGVGVLVTVALKDGVTVTVGDAVGTALGDCDPLADRLDVTDADRSAVACLPATSKSKVRNSSRHKQSM